MTTRLILLRHGETLSNIEMIYQGQGDSPLSSLGVEEAGQLAGALSLEKFAGIYCSTLLRSMETARLVGEPHNLAPIPLPGLIERFYGDFEGLKFTDIKQNYPEIYETWLLHPDRAKIPKAETLLELQARGVKAIEKIISQHKGKTVCVVGHGGLNRTILFHYMNLGLDNFWRIRQDNCCVNIIEFDRHPIVTLLNSTWFLGEKRFSKMEIY
ncbi:histidine phosphatase family protein [Candidatus Saganbacteria bacterium]|nr:histidine phosphatase family protein [Candidatus Saganbacteria bacterium]